MLYLLTRHWLLMAFPIDIKILLSVRMVIVFFFISLLIINLVSLPVSIVIIRCRYFGIGCSIFHVQFVAEAKGLNLISLNFIFPARDLVNAFFIAVF